MTTAQLQRRLTAFGLAILTILSYATAQKTAQASAGTEDPHWDETIPNIEVVFQDLGFAGDYNIQRFNNLCTYLANRQEAYEAAKASDDKEVAKAAKKIAPFLAYGSALCTAAKAGNAAASADRADTKQKAYLLGKRIVYSTLTQDIPWVRANHPEYFARPEEEAGIKKWRQGLLANLIRGLEGLLGRETISERDLIKGKRIVFPLIGLPQVNFAVPIPSPRSRSALSASQAAKESKFLVKPGYDGYLKPEDLEGMSLSEVANLDIGDDHPVWYSNRRLGQIDAAMAQEFGITDKTAARWQYFVNNLETAMRAKHPHYRLDHQRHLFFFDKLKDSATSPKIEVADAYGVEWKLKWGDEVQTEVMANRLYIGLGGRFADLVYAYPTGFAKKAPATATPTPHDGLILILGKENGKAHRKAAAKGECFAFDKASLKACLLNKSHYEYNIEPNILTEAPITRAFYDEHLTAYAPAGMDLDEWYKDEFKGRKYVTFREVMVEFQGKPAMVRGGTSAYSGVGALDDRIARGSSLFNMWIGNRDAKDANNKAYLLKSTPETRPLGINADLGYFVETQHDLGYSFGQFLAAGEINALAGKGFIDKCLGGAGWRSPLTICFKESLLYIPEAWKHATYADTLWFAKKINSISKTQLRAIAAHTHWPDFMQTALVSKLLMRQQGIAHELSLPENQESPAWVRIDFSNLAATAARYGIGLAALERRWQAMGQPAFEDIVQKGQVIDCEDSVLMDLIQKARHPAGLTQRMSRLVDFQDEVGCKAKRASLRDTF